MRPTKLNVKLIFAKQKKKKNGGIYGCIMPPGLV